MATKRLVKYALTGVNTEQFAKIFVPEKDDNINLNISININSDYKNGAIAITPSISFIESDKTFLIIECTCHFKIDPSDWSKISNTGKSDAIVSKNIIMNMISIALGTSRGVLHSKTENTDYNKYFLPLIDISEFEIGELVMVKSEEHII